jgi:superfamily II DNA or RNA helicase
MQIILPKLEKMIWQQPGNKNQVVQLLAKELEVDFPILDSGRSHLVIGDDEVKYCLTSNENNTPEGFNYVIKTNKRPTEHKLLDNEIMIKGWLRHPAQVDHSDEEVRASWSRDFHYIEEDLGKKENGLRLPQIGAIYAILSHLKVADETGTVVMPTGTGKTEVMLSVLVANQCERLLVTVPTDALREQIFKKFVSLGLLKDFMIVGGKSLYPRVGIVNNGFADIEELEQFVSQCNVIVTTMQLVADSPVVQQKKMSAMCSHLFIDEAHHAKAKSWQAFADNFKDSQIIQFTATPFRNDQQRLDGKVIFDFPLKKAQEQGYFKKINFVSVREYDTQKADALIAEAAVKKLREDRKAGYNHILMARCGDKKRAQEIFKLYVGYEDLNPVCIYSGISKKAEVLRNIVYKKHKIIVCVDMLGEGFDLPELKIAAMHDVRKSLPITLQYAGRFTRTKLDEKLGEATFIANLADLDVTEALEKLYAQDTDWNLILRILSADEIIDVINYEELLAGFTNLSEAVIPFQNIRPALSAVVYKNHSPGWRPQNFRHGITNYDDYDVKFHDINQDKKLLVIVTAEKADIEWGKFNDVYQLVWNVIIVHWDTDNNLLFIHGSDKKPLYQKLAKAIIGDSAEIINEVDPFKAFAGINRVILKNVGLKEFLGKNIRFRMSVGADVEKALSMAEMQKGQKAFVVGTGYENGSKVSLGCSYKGRIWSLQKGDLNQFTVWCHKIGKKLLDEQIDANQILHETLIPELVATRPAIFPVWVDWHMEIYQHLETKLIFRIDGHFYDLSSCELCILEPSTNGELLFELVTADRVVVLEKSLYEKNIDDDRIPEFSISNRSGKEILVSFGRKEMLVEEFFQEYPPTIWFADGSALTGNNYVQLKNAINPYPRDNIIAWDWSGVNLHSESQHVTPKIQDSIQYKVIKKLQDEDVDIIYDDDYAGEVADLITIKQHQAKLHVCFYHLKYAKGGTVSDRIDNFYEVCGQAQKSIHWKHKDGNEFINHLLRRENKKRDGLECSRLEKGTKDDLEKLLHIAKKKIPIEWEIFIVQPGGSKAAMSEDILTLLGVTENYLMEIAGIKLGVIVSE